MPVRTRAQTKALRDKKAKALQKQKTKIREYKKEIKQKQEQPNIVFNAARSGQMKLRQTGHFMERFCFNCRKPTDAKTIQDFIDAYIKTNFKDSQGYYWISANFEGIGWRSSKKIELRNPNSALFNPADFEIYDGTNHTVKFDQPLSDFHIYVLQSNKTKAGGATINKYNDCLFNSLEKAVNGSLPKEISTQPKLKQFLGLQRADPVPIELISKIEPLFKNVSITVSGDYQRLTAEKPLNIHLALQDNHYFLKYNTPNKKTSMAKYNPVKEENVWAYFKESVDKYVMFNGITTRLNVSHAGFTEVRKDFGCIIVKADSRQDEEGNKRSVTRQELKQTWADFIKNAKDTYYESEYFIDMMKYPCLTVAAQDLWRQTAKIYNVAEPMSQNEQLLISKSLRGGLIWCEKGATGNGSCYDINSMYPSVMVNQYFQFPVKAGVAMKLTAAEFNELKYYKCGIYDAVVEGTSMFFKPAAKGCYYTHFDLTLAKELGLSIKINDGDWNFYCYNQDSLVKGSLLFGPFVEKIYALKKANPSNKTYKGLLRSLWGKLCEKAKLRKIIKDNDKDIFDLPPNAELKTIDTLDGGIKVKYFPDASKLYKNQLARVGCFLTSYARLTFVRQVAKYKESIVRIHTDSVLLKAGCIPDFKLSDDLGCWKIDDTGAYTVGEAYEKVKWA